MVIILCLNYKMLCLTPIKNSWINVTNSDRGASTSGMNKLRTYKRFKDAYEVEAYMKTVMPRCHRSALAKFRCGVAPIRVETGRYERLPLDERFVSLL